MFAHAPSRTVRSPNMSKNVAKHFSFSFDAAKVRTINEGTNKKNA